MTKQAYFWTDLAANTRPSLLTRQMPTDLLCSAISTRLPETWLTACSSRGFEVEQVTAERILRLTLLDPTGPCSGILIKSVEPFDGQVKRCSLLNNKCQQRRFTVLRASTPSDRCIQSPEVARIVEHNSWLRLWQKISRRFWRQSTLTTLGIHPGKPVSRVQFRQSVTYILGTPHWLVAAL